MTRERIVLALGARGEDLCLGALGAGENLYCGSVA
jgi:hypothetical protein